MGRRKTRGRKGKTSKVSDSHTLDDDQENALSAAQELYPMPSSRYSKRNNSTVREDNIQSYAHGDQAEAISGQLLQKDCELNKEASLNITELVHKLNKNLSDAEEVDSATHTGLVTVAGYKVKGEVAPLLRGILTEHGDIANECILQTPETRAALLESVCMIYRELEPKLPNITSLEVNKIQARIKDLETVRLRVDWLYKRLQQISAVKGLLEKSRSLDEAKARCAESIEREERDLEALEVELSNLQQQISSRKAELTLLKTEAEMIEAAFETVNRLEAFPENSVVSVTRRTGGKIRSRPMPSSEVLNRKDPQLHSQTTLHHNGYIFGTDTHQQLRENDHPQADHVSVAYLKAPSCNTQVRSQSFDRPCNSRPPHSLPQSVSQNMQLRSADSNLHAHSNRLSKPLHSAQFSSENECDQNYDASSDDVDDMNTPGGDYTPENNRGFHNQGSNLTEPSDKRIRGIRGITKPLRCWGSGQKMMLQLDLHNQVTGKLASPFASQLGVLAKDGKKLPLIYTDWRTIPADFKDRVWKEIKDNTNLQDDQERAILQKLSLVWRCWKGKVKKLYFTPYRNDNEKLSQHPPDARIEKDQWPILVRFWKSRPVLEPRMESKININDQRKDHQLRGHMAFAVSPNRTQVPESLSVLPFASYIENHRREIPIRDTPSAEVYTSIHSSSFVNESCRKRKKMHLEKAANLEGLYTSTP